MGLGSSARQPFIGVHGLRAWYSQRGEDVWDPSKQRNPPNLASDWQSRPMVVYDIAQDGTTGMPSVTVACISVRLCNC